jgi:hypothetical protein
MQIEDIEDLPELLESLYKHETQEFSYFFDKNKRVNTPISITRNSLTRFTFSIKKPSSFVDCIKITLEKEKFLELDWYYYLVRQTECPFIDHDDFFKALKKIAKVFKVDLKIGDLSTKKLGQCNLQMPIFALAGEKSFYSKKAQADNPEFYAEMRSHGKIKLNQLHSLYKDDPSKEEEINALVNMVHSLRLPEDCTISQLCKLILKECKNEKRTPQVQRVLNEIASKLPFIFDIQGTQEFTFQLPSKTRAKRIAIRREQRARRNTARRP